MRVLRGDQPEATRSCIRASIGSRRSETCDRPHVLVLGEPTTATGLDPRSRQVVWPTIRELVRDGVTLLLTTPLCARTLADWEGGG